MDRFGNELKLTITYTCCHQLLLITVYGSIQYVGVPHPLCYFCQWIHATTVLFNIQHKYNMFPPFGYYYVHINHIICLSYASYKWSKTAWSIELLAILYKKINLPLLTDMTPFQADICYIITHAIMQFRWLQARAMDLKPLVTMYSHNFTNLIRISIGEHSAICLLSQPMTPTSLSAIVG